jgi:hypothetical protein
MACVAPVPRGYEELVWILRQEACPPGLSVSDGVVFDDAGIDATDLLNTLGESNFDMAPVSPPASGRTGWWNGLLFGSGRWGGLSGTIFFLFGSCWPRFQ